MVLNNTTAFALQSKFIHRVFFPEYPDFEIKAKSNCYNYYKKWIFNPVNQHRMMELKSINKKRQTYSEVMFHPKRFEEKKIPSMQQYLNLAYLSRSTEKK